MKQIILFIIIMAISFSCKKQSVEPIPEEPIKTSKSFQVKITFTADSLCSMSNPIPGYYPSGVQGGVTYPNTFVISIDTIPNSITVNSKSQSIAGPGPTFTHTLTLNITSNDLNKPFTYYIHVEESLNKPNQGGHVYYRYNKLYTFNEGDNGIINFNILP